MCLYGIKREINVNFSENRGLKSRFTFDVSSALVTEGLFSRRTARKEHESRSPLKKPVYIEQILRSCDLSNHVSSSPDSNKLCERT